MEMKRSENLFEAQVNARRLTPANLEDIKVMFMNRNRGFKQYDENRLPSSHPFQKSLGILLEQKLVQPETRLGRFSLTPIAQEHLRAFIKNEFED